MTNDCPRPIDQWVWYEKCVGTNGKSLWLEKNVRRRLTISEVMRKNENCVKVDHVTEFDIVKRQTWGDFALLWCHNGRDGISNHQPHDCFLSRSFRRWSKKTSKLRVTGLCAGNSSVTGEFPAQMASNAENVSIWWRHHDKVPYL